MDDGPTSSADNEQAAEPRHSNSRGKTKSVLSEKKLQRLQEDYNKRGIVYLSRIPPHMKPQKLRHLLSQYGEIGRIYLAPEDPGLRKKRKQTGKDTGKNFTEGWVEFEDKKLAKQVAAMLNGQAIGGKKRSAYHYDLWAIKYLPKFKWDHLTEELAYLKAIHDQKLAAEISAAKRERDFYLGQVDKAKAVKAMSERRQQRKEEVGADQGGGKANEPAVGQKRHSGDDQPILRAYKQRKVKPDQVKDPGAPGLSSDLLQLVAGKR